MSGHVLFLEGYKVILGSDLSAHRFWNRETKGLFSSPEGGEWTCPLPPSGEWSSASGASAHGQVQRSAVVQRWRTVSFRAFIWHPGASESDVLLPSAVVHVAAVTPLLSPARVVPARSELCPLSGQAGTHNHGVL